jgi:hypothetical protein
MGRWFLAFFGLVLVCQGAFELRRDHPFYPNYWGGPVFGWFAIVVGLVISSFALFIPGRLQKAWSKERTSGAPGGGIKRS